MNSVDELAGPSLPNWFLLPATGIFALLTLYWILRTRGRAARFVLFAFWFRYTLSSLHEFTYREAFGNLKWVALGSIVMVSAGFLVLEKRRFLAPAFWPVGLICGLMIISALLNQMPMAAVEPIVRFLIFVLIAVAIWQALEAGGSSLLRRLLLVFIQPLTYQLASVVLGVAKSGELDGSISYIGGYYHEELFSLIAATAFLVAALANGVPKFQRLGICAISLVAISLANYRTTMLGVLPLAAIALFTAAPRAFEPEQRKLARLMIVFAGVLSIGVIGVLEAQRFSDLAGLSEGTSLIKAPETFSVEDRQMLSSRPYIWSTYIYAYLDSTPLQKLIGQGPDAWDGKMPNYAHNTLISFLYELGIAGAAAILLLWGGMFRLAFQADKRSRSLLLGGHLSFLVLNMATMAHWQVEGNFLYGILCGYTIAKARQARVARLTLQRMARPHPPISWGSSVPLLPAQNR